MIGSPAMKLRLALLGLLMQLAASVLAADTAPAVRDAWIRPAPPNAPVLAGYMVLDNRSTAAAVLVGASSRAFGKVTIHRTEHVAGVANMTHMAGVEIAAHGKAVFEPGAYHLMLAQPKRPLSAGDSVPVVLRFADGTRVPATFQVREPEAASAHEHVAQESRPSGNRHGAHR